MGKTADFFNSFRQKNKKGFGVLIDPDKTDVSKISSFVKEAEEAGVDFFLVGSSFLYEASFEEIIVKIKDSARLPVVIFPGNALQLSRHADGILYLSLLSGRNPQFLIGEHVIASPKVFKIGLEPIPTGYILIESGKTTAVEFMSNTKAIPSDKHEIIAAHALAGEHLGMKMIYLEAGSGAQRAVSPRAIATVRQILSIPLIVGGGIRTPEMAALAVDSGADIVIVGTFFEDDKNQKQLKDFANAVHGV